MSDKMRINLNERFIAKEEESPCKGVFFRYTENNYAYDGKIVLSRQMKMLKSTSCRGCDKCGWLLDDVNEGVANFGAGHFELPDDLTHGDIVRLTFVADSHDWETGYVESSHLKVIKAPQPQLSAPYIGSKITS